MMLRRPPFHRHHVQKYAVCPGQSAGCAAPGLSSFLTSKQEVSVEGKHHTRTTTAPLKHEKSLLFLTGFPLLMAGAPRRINKQLASACTGGQQPRLWR